MRNVIAALALIATMTLLSGCVHYPTEAERVKEQAKAAKVCEDAGGSYEYNAWNGYLCDFGKDNS